MLLLSAKEVWGKVIFSEACVKKAVHRGGGLPQCMLGYQTPREEAPPEQSMLEVWSTSGQYASYWNAILLSLSFVLQSSFTLTLLLLS